MESSLVPVLSYILTKMVERNDKVPLNSSKRTVFHADKAPLISLPRYLERVLSFAPCSNSCFIIALIYIDRIIQNHSDFILNSLSVHRMLITSVMLATKFFDDETFNNLYYAKVGGLQISELNQLEEKFLMLIDFSLTIQSDLFERYRCELMKHSKVNCPKAALSCSSSKGSHESNACESSRSSLSKSSGNVVSSTPSCPSSASTAPRSLRSSAPAIVPSRQPPSLVRSVCEALIIESVKNKATHPQLITRMSELLTAEEKLHKKLPPGTIKTLCTRLTSENNLSPTLVARATAHAERLERLEKMDSHWYQTGCDYAARDPVLSPTHPTKFNTEVNALDFSNMSVNSNKGAGFTAQCTPTGYATSSNTRHATNMVAV